MSLVCFRAFLEVANTHVYTLTVIYYAYSVGIADLVIYTSCPPFTEMTYAMRTVASLRNFRYSYNGYGWLTSAEYGEGEALTGNRARYTEKSTSFTRNRGVKALQRNGLRADGTYGKVDDLTVSYTGNRVTGVSDAAPAVTRNGSMDYPGGNTSKVLTYNVFGALASDGGRGITSVSYDRFGNPVKTVCTGNRSVTNVYSATGEKLKTVHAFNVAAQAAMSLVPDVECASVLADGTDVVGGADSSTTEYHGSLVYRDGRLGMILFPGGYATVSGATVTFHYYTRDYLGNNRAVINGSTGALEQTVAYYPYGGVIPNMSTNPTTVQPYKFGGKELITANGLNEYDFGARQYYSAVPGFACMDPLCEGFPHLSPYLFCGNDPVNNVDPSGMVFTETSQQYIDMFMSNIESRLADNDRNIAKIVAELNKGDLSKKKINSLQRGMSKLEGTNASLKEVKTEVTALQESTQIYNIYRDDRFNSVDSYGATVEIGSGVRYNEETDMFDIILGDDSLGMLAHELKHAYQFETGDFSSGYNKTGSPFYDQTDEVEAYARGAMFGLPENNNFQKKYGMFQKDASGVRYLNEIIQNSSRALQNIANNTKSIFRWNGITYKYKK